MVLFEAQLNCIFFFNIGLNSGGDPPFPLSPKLIAVDVLGRVVKVLVSVKKSICVSGGGGCPDN